MNESTRNFLIFLFLLYIISAPVSDESRYPSYIDKDYILDQYHKEVNVSRLAILDDYDMGYGNITGFKLSYKDSLDGKNQSNWPFPNKGPFKEDQSHSILPDDVIKMAGGIWNHEGKVVDIIDSNGSKINDGSFPLNISGSVSGDFILNQDYNLHKIQMDIPEYLLKLYEYREEQKFGNDQDDNGNDINFGGDDDDDNSYEILKSVNNQIKVKRPGNVTDMNGEVKLNFINIPTDVNDTNIVSLSLKINDKYEKNEHNLNFNGVYHQDSGNLVITTKSSKFQGLYALPHLNLGPGDLFNRTKYTIYDTLNQTMISDLNFPYLESYVDSIDQCEYIGYFHFESTNLTKSQLIDIDNELINPLGRPNKKLPDLKITNGLLYSPDCGILMNMDNLIGTRNEVFNNELKNLVLSAIGLMTLQLILIIRQMSIMSSPSSLAKLSFWSIMIMNTIDSGVCIISLIMSLIFTELYIQLAMLSFLSFTCSALYEMKFGIQIYCIQINERPLDWRTMLQGTPIDERQEERQQQQQEEEEQAQRQPNENGEETEPSLTQENPIITTTPATPTVPIDGSEQAIGAELYSRNFFFLLVLIFLLLNVITWPRTSRRVIEYIFTFIFNSIWISQIYRNTLRGSRASFTWEFILGESILRLVPFIYIELLPNPFNHHKDVRLVVILISWVSFQILMLYLQEEYGPRFFLSEKYLPKTYDYHPMVKKSDLGLFHVDPSTVDGELWVTDCAICMQKIEIPLDDSSCEEESAIETDQFDQANDLESGLLPHGPLSSSHRHGVRLIKRKKYMITPCFHVFHTNCLESWMMYKLQCPNCRSSIPPF